MNTGKNFMNKRTQRAAYNPPLVISAHGIRTHGRWQKTLGSVLSGRPTKYECYDFGRYGLLRFLVPAINNRMIEYFYHWYSVTVAKTSGVDLAAYDKRRCLV